MKQKLSFPRVVVRGVLVVLAILTVYPFWYVLCMSLSTYKETVGHDLIFWPVGFTLNNVKYVLQTSDFLNIYGNTMFVVIVGTILSLAITILFAYPLSRKVPGWKWMQYVTFFTMLFSGGTIPTFMVVRLTGLYNSLWALILPGVMNPFNVFLMRNFFDGIPRELDECAEIEGASNVWIMMRIMIPLSLAGMATLALFYGVGYWNAYFNALIYIGKREKWVLQVLLREILVTNQPDLLGSGTSSMSGEGTGSQMAVTLKMATIIVSTLPVMVIYPFIQKYFVTGVMVGAVKG